MVADTDMDRSGSAASNLRAIVDLPAPEGEDRTNRTPRRLKSGMSAGMVSAMAASGRKDAFLQEAGDRRIDGIA